MSNIEKYDPIRVLGEGSFGKVSLNPNVINSSSFNFYSHKLFNLSNLQLVKLLAVFYFLFLCNL